MERWPKIIKGIKKRRREEESIVHLFRFSVLRQDIQDQLFYFFSKKQVSYLPLSILSSLSLTQEEEVSVGVQSIYKGNGFGMKCHSDIFTCEERERKRDMMSKRSAIHSFLPVNDPAMTGMSVMISFSSLLKHHPITYFEPHSYLLLLLYLLFRRCSLSLYLLFWSFIFYFFLSFFLCRSSPHYQNKTAIYYIFTLWFFFLLFFFMFPTLPDVERRSLIDWIGVKDDTDEVINTQSIFGPINGFYTFQFYSSSLFSILRKRYKVRGNRTHRKRERESLP